MKRPIEKWLRDPGPSIYLTLSVKYLLIFVYGVWSEFVGVTTIGIVAGRTYAVLWPVLISVFAVVAVIGVARSRRVSKRGLEVVSTILLFATMFGYTLAILIRAYLDQDYTGAPVAVLIVALSVAPGARLIGIARSAKGSR